MSKLFDALTRSLLEKYPADWLNQLGLIHGEPVRVINSDLSSVTAEADKVIRVEGPQPWLVHIELQAGYDRTLPRRLLRYNALLNVKHDLAVHTVAILLHHGADGPELTGERKGPPTLWYLGNVDGPQCHARTGRYNGMNSVPPGKTRRAWRLEYRASTRPHGLSPERRGTVRWDRSGPSYWDACSTPTPRRFGFTHASPKTSVIY